jgi:hypothetical protein
MKAKGLVILIMSIIALGCDPVNAQDKVYAAFMDNDWSSEVKSITASPSTGTTTGNFGSAINVQVTAAIGYGNWGGNGYIISLQYTTGENVDIYAHRADGSGSNVKIINNADLVSGDIELDYVRLGIDHNGIGWIVSKRTSSNTIYVASFTWNGNMSSPSVTITRRGILNTNDNSNNIFVNGDLAIASNTLFILANNGSGSTKIYTCGLTNLLSSNASSTNSITSKWTLKDANNNNFSGSVNGFAFASTGSAYLSTSSGLYFIDQNTTNFSGTGTVKCTLVKSESNISDLATGYWPTTTTLPVKIKSIKVYIKRD